MKSFIFAGIILLSINDISIFYTTKQKKIEEKVRLPLYIKYLNGDVPSDLKGFINVQFQLKKLKIIDYKQAHELSLAQLQQKSMALIESGEISGFDDVFKREKFENSVKEPVCNMLALKIFNTPNRDSIYIIDSIHWQIKYIPVFDTINNYKNFIPEVSTEKSTYESLKRFSELVLKSGDLK